MSNEMTEKEANRIMDFATFVALNEIGYSASNVKIAEDIARECFVAYCKANGIEKILVE